MKDDSWCRKGFSALGIGVRDLEDREVVVVAAQSAPLLDYLAGPDSVLGFNLSFIA